MQSIMAGNTGRKVVAFIIFLLFALYLGLILLKTSVSFGNGEIAFSGQSPLMACGPDCMQVAHGFLYYGTFDLLRTASASLLMGLIGGLCLLRGTPGPRRGFAIAMVILGPIVVITACLGEVQTVARLLLIAIGVFGIVDGGSALLREAKGERAAS